MPPKASTAAAISVATDASSATSNGTAIAVPPLEVMLSATSLAADSFTSPTTTFAPSSARRVLVAVPIPPAPPAITTTLSLSPRIGSASRGSERGRVVTLQRKREQRVTLVVRHSAAKGGAVGSGRVYRVA